MPAPSRKRARVSKDRDSVPSTFSNKNANLSHILQSFDHEVTTKILLKAAKAHPSVSALIHREHSRQIALDPAKVLTFDELSKSAWEAINVRYARMSSSRQFDAAPDAISEIESAISGIRKRLPQQASYATKMNALEALRQIGESVCSGTEVIGREVRKSFGSGSTLAKAMEGILYEMSQDEWEKFKRAGWAKQLQEVVKVAESYAILRGPRKVLDLVEDGNEDGKEGEEGMEEEYDEEEEEEDEKDEEEESEKPKMSKPAKRRISRI